MLWKQYLNSDLFGFLVQVLFCYQAFLIGEAAGSGALLSEDNWTVLLHLMPARKLRLGLETRAACSSSERIMGGEAESGAQLLAFRHGPIWGLLLTTV